MIGLAGEVGGCRGNVRSNMSECIMYVNVFVYVVEDSVSVSSTCSLYGGESVLVRYYPVKDECSV